MNHFLYELKISTNMPCDLQSSKRNGFKWLAIKINKTEYITLSVICVIVGSHFYIYLCCFAILFSSLKHFFVITDMLTMISHNIQNLDVIFYFFRDIEMALD